MKPRAPRDVPSIVEFCKDSQLLGLTLSPAQEALLRAIYGLPLDGSQLELWRQCTRRATYPGLAFAEVTVVAGARSGKDSRIAAPVVCYEAVFGGHERCLARGERGVIPLVAQDARATKVAFGYVRDYLMNSPLLASLVAEKLANEVGLANGIGVMCFPCTQGEPPELVYSSRGHGRSRLFSVLKALPTATQRSRRASDAAWWGSPTHGWSRSQLRT